VHDPDYAELLRRSLQEFIVAHRAYLDDFEFVDLKLEGSHPDQHFVLLFRRTGIDDCLWASRSPSLWVSDDDPDLDWLPLDRHAAIDEYVDLIFRRLASQLWPLYIQDDGPCNPDASGISWTPWRLGGRS